MEHVPLWVNGPGTMADSTLVGLFIVLSISQVFMMLFAVYFAYQIMRKVGTFWAWTVMVIAFSLFALRDFTGVASVLSTPLDQLSAKTDVFTWSSVWPGTIINEAAYAALMIATYGLEMIFRGRTAKRQDRAATGSSIPKWLQA